MGPYAPESTVYRSKHVAIVVLHYNASSQIITIDSADVESCTTCEGMEGLASHNSDGKLHYTPHAPICLSLISASHAQLSFFPPTPSTPTMSLSASSFLRMSTTPSLSTRHQPGTTRPLPRQGSPSSCTLSGTSWN